MNKGTFSIFKTWKGYEVGLKRPGHNLHIYVGTVYAGKVTYVTDYLHAKKYKTEAAAERIARMIEAGALTEVN